MRKVIIPSRRRVAVWLTAILMLGGVLSGCRVVEEHVYYVDGRTEEISLWDPGESIVEWYGLVREQPPAIDLCAPMAVVEELMRAHGVSVDVQKTFVDAGVPVNGCRVVVGPYDFRTVLAGADPRLRDRLRMRIRSLGGGAYRVRYGPVSSEAIVRGLDVTQFCAKGPDHAACVAQVELRGEEVREVMVVTSLAYMRSVPFVLRLRGAVEDVVAPAAGRLTHGEHGVWVWETTLADFVREGIEYTVRFGLEETTD